VEGTFVLAGLRFLSVKVAMPMSPGVLFVGSFLSEKAAQMSLVVVVVVLLLHL